MDEYLAKKYGSKPKKTKKRKVEEEPTVQVTQTEIPTQTQPTKKTGGWKTLSGQPIEDKEETVYRDASGNVISVDDQISVLQKRQEEKIAAERRQKENLLGSVQVEEARKRKAKEEAMKHTRVGVSANDQAYNEERKSKAVFADPAAKFGKSKSTSKIDAGSLHDYTGSFPSNRFNIKPGCLWDGNDRGNGFEGKWLGRQEEKRREADVSYQNEVDF